MTQRLSYLATLLLLVMLSACECTPNGGKKFCLPSFEDVIASSIQVDLNEGPGLGLVASHYCDTHFSHAEDVQTCVETLGTPADLDVLDFIIDVQVEALNRSDATVRAEAMLLSIEITTGPGVRAHGATCISLCEAEEPGCGDPTPAQACGGASGFALDWSDMAHVIPGLVSGLADGATGLELEETDVASFDHLSLNATLHLSPSEMLSVIADMTESFMDTVLEDPDSTTLTLPVHIEGTLFLRNSDGAVISAELGTGVAQWELR
jgi:hypothetical protein